jgi:hypothetical protein
MTEKNSRKERFQMKNLKKMLAVVTAISAMFASVSAFAQTNLSDCDTGISGSCTGEDGANPVVTAAVDSSIVDGGEMTFLVLNKDVNPLTTDVAADDILYIDQQSSTAGTSFTGPINLDRVDDDLTALPEGTYYVRIGYNSKTTGEFAIANAKLVIESAGPSGTTVTILWGDVDQSGSVNVNDSTKLLNWIIGGSAVCGDYTINTTASITIND